MNTDLMQTSFFETEGPVHPAFLDPDLIDADPDQPRREFDPAGLRSLMQSIAAVGVIHPLVVRPQPGGRYVLVAGERRLRAVRMGCREHPDNPYFRQVPVRVSDGPADELTRIRCQVDENRIRADLTPGEIAGAYRAARVLLEIREAERYADALGVLPDGYDPAATVQRRRRVLAGALRRKGAAWPNVSWADVFDRLGQPVDRRVLAILRIPDAVLQRCSELGLSKSAAAALAELPGQADQMAVLDAVARAGDPSLAAPVTAQLLADPSLGADGALQMVLAARQAVRAAAGRDGQVPAGQMVLPKPPCPTAEFDRIAAALRESIGLVETYALSEYQAGSIRLLAEKLLAEVGAAPGAAGATANGG